MSFSQAYFNFGNTYFCSEILQPKRVLIQKRKQPNNINFRKNPSNFKVDNFEIRFKHTINYCSVLCFFTKYFFVLVVDDNSNSILTSPLNKSKSADAACDAVLIML